MLSLVTEGPEVPNSAPALGMLLPVGNEAMEVQGAGLTSAQAPCPSGIHNHTSLLPSWAAENGDLPPGAALLFSAPK